MKKIWLYIFTICVVSISCEKEDYTEDFPLPFNGNIYEYNLENGQVGDEQIINTYEENRVIVEVEFGTDLTNVTPTIEISPGAIIEPGSGETVSFAGSNELVYTITAPSGLEHEWIVEIVEQEDPNAPDEGDSDGEDSDGEDTNGEDSDGEDTDEGDSDGEDSDEAN